MTRRRKSTTAAAAGFTLIEIMVALSILAVMTVLTAGAIQNAIRSRAKTTGLIARESAVRDALRVIERDVNCAFHYRDILPEAVGTGSTNPNQPPTPTPTPDPSKPVVPQLTQFIGERDRLDFTALSHVRTSRDAVESDQEEVGYYIAPCRARTRDKSVDTSCLWRRQATQIDDDVTKGGESSPLIEHVETFKLRYLGPDKEDWQETWKTDKSGDDKTKDKFPYAVEVTLKVHNKTDPNGKPYQLVMVAEIRFPNNAPKKEPPKP
jgi:prepilin-type N-terminal cleavage/methylation domain-containing protein